MSSPGSDKGPLGRSDEAQMKRQRRKAAKSRPLDETALKDLALSYAARFATTGAKLESYLVRKVRERGVAQDADGRTVELDITGLVTRLIELGYVDDDAYARAKSRDLTARGYGARRVEQALWAAGVSEEVREDHAPSQLSRRQAAILLARKRGFGPFGNRLASSEDQGEAENEARRKQREKQVAAMLRAGHEYDDVRFIIDAAGTDEIEAWLSEAEDRAEDNSPFKESGSW